MACKNKHRSTTVLEEILLDLHCHIATLAWLIQKYLFLVKKVIRTNTENSDLAGQLFKLLKILLISKCSTVCCLKLKMVNNVI